MPDELTWRGGARYSSLVIDQQSDTRERLVATARELFWAHGYHATGISRILAEAGAGSGSLYHFFRSKEALLLAVLDHYLELLDPVIVEPAFSRTRDPLARIGALLDVYREALLATGFVGGCPIGNLALEVSDLGPEVREGLQRNFRAWCARVEACLAAALPSQPADVHATLATFVLTVMEGAVMQARASRSIAPFDASVRHLRAYLDHLTAEATE
ncbi:MAG: TetR/AcrR family transcriptional regulator [Gemmatimonadota bacterium]